MDELAAPIYTIGQACDAAGVNASTVRDWFRRGDLTLGLQDKASPGTTIARRVTAQTALMIGIAGALNRRGVHPKEGAFAAALFVHTDTCGYLFADGDTYLVVGAHSSRVVSVGAQTRFDEVFEQPLYGADQSPILTILRLNELVDRIRVGLGLERDPLTGQPEAAAGYVGSA